MRQIQRKQKKAKATAQEPITETIIPLDPQGKRFWKSMSDEEIVAYARRYINENGIKNRKGLYNADNGLYNALRRRKLLDKVKFKERLRNWSSMSDKRLVEHAQNFVDENDIINGTGLKKVDSGLYEILRNRNLICKIKFENNRRSWRQTVY